MFNRIKSHQIRLEIPICSGDVVRTIFHAPQGSRGGSTIKPDPKQRSNIYLWIKGIQYRADTLLT